MYFILIQIFNLKECPGFSYSFKNWSELVEEMHKYSRLFAFV